MYLTDMGLINSTNGLEGKFVVFEDHEVLLSILSFMGVSNFPFLYLGTLPDITFYYTVISFFVV